jgi:hypothetical protein
MSDPQPLSEADEADLAAFADGRLEPDRRAALEARIESDARLAHALDRQRAGLTAITAAAASVSAPMALRARVEAMQREPEPRRRWRMPSLRLWLPAAGLAAAVVIVAAIVVLGGGAPSTDTIIAAATRPPTASVSLDPRQPALLRDRVEAVRFPNFEQKFGWEAKGTRTDELDGRDTRTVFYRREGREAAYTIVGGEALPWPDGERTEIEGIKLRSFTQGDRTVVTWRRGGHTCVISGRDVSKASLLELAAWKGKGAVTF